MVQNRNREPFHFELLRGNGLNKCHGVKRHGEEKTTKLPATGLFGLLLEEGDEVVAVLVLLETTEGHLGAGNVLLGVLEVLELGCVSLDKGRTRSGASPTRVFSSHVMPFCLLASVYE